jgi:hypothetical protein
MYSQQHIRLFWTLYRSYSKVVSAIIELQVYNLTYVVRMYIYVINYVLEQLKRVYKQIRLLSIFISVFRSYLNRQLEVSINKVGDKNKTDLIDNANAHPNSETNGRLVAKDR